MPVPSTTGQLRTKVSEMEIGDYIKIGNNGSGWIVNNGTVEIPTTGKSTFVSGDYYYLIKLDTGLLVSDRVIQNTISWDTLNGVRQIQGFPVTIDGINMIYRSLTGGVAYADGNGNLSTTDLGLGAFPTNNEWDKYIVNFPSEKIADGKTLDDVFHVLDAQTWCQDTTDIALSASTTRVGRGKVSEEFVGYGLASNSTATTRGFRPVFAYKE